MAEYVLLADAKRIFCEGCQFRYGCNPEGISVCPNHQRLNKAATDKVRSAVRSEWIINDVGDNTLYAKCKHCLTTQVLYCGKQPTNFCPNCGADMRETGR